MKRESYRPLKPLGLLLLAALIAGVPSLASAHRDWDDDKGIIVAPERHKYYKPYKYYRHKKPRVIREYHYYQPYVIERYARPRVRKYYYYAPRYPSGNLNLSIDFPFNF
jgi:hypothetical protein